MNAKETLEKAIQKAIDGGWTFFGKYKPGMKFFADAKSLDTGEIQITLELDREGSFKNTPVWWTTHHPVVIFSHDFAKALWMPGQAEQIIAYQFHERLARNNEDLMESGIIPIWKYHLMQMAVAPDPISYLAENMP